MPSKVEALRVLLGHTYFGVMSFLKGRDLSIVSMRRLAIVVGSY